MNELPRPFFVLAPMYDVTDVVFRQVIDSLAPPDLYFSEFVNVDGLQSAGREKIIHRLKVSDSDKPIVAQIWGKVPENYYQTALELPGMGFQGIDINMGCPDKSIVKNGCCSALINNHGLAHEIIESTKKGAAGKVPVSVKTRLGYREFDEDWLRFLFEQKLNMLTIHLRTVKEMSKVPAHYELIEKISELRNNISPETLLVINGDIADREHGEKLALENNVDGIMIGRGVFNNPYAFAKRSPWENMSAKEKIEIYKRHVTLFSEVWNNEEYPIVVLNKFCKIYVNGFEGAKEIREKLMGCSSLNELREQLDSLYNSI